MKKLLVVIGVIVGIAVVAVGAIVVHNYLNGAATITGDSGTAVILEVETGNELLVGQNLILTKTDKDDAEPMLYTVRCEKTDGDRASFTRVWDEKQLVLNLDAKSHYNITVTPEKTDDEAPLHTWKVAVSKNISKCTAYRVADAGQIGAEMLRNLTAGK